MDSKQKDNNSTPEFSSRLKELINEKGLSLRDLAADMGVTFTALSDWQRGNKTPRADSIVILARYFGVSSDYLLGLTDVRTSETDIRSVAEYTGLSENAISTLQNHYLSNTIEWGRYRRSVLNEFLENTELIKEFTNFLVLFRCFARKKVEYSILSSKYYMRDATDDMDLYQFKVQNRINMFVESQRQEAIKEAVHSIAKEFECQDKIANMSIEDSIEFLRKKCTDEEKKEENGSALFQNLFQSAFPAPKSYSEYAEELHFSDDDLDFYDALVAAHAESGENNGSNHETD